MHEALCRLCDGSHKHCKLEGYVSGYGSRTKFMEDYQPGFAARLAAALMVPEVPQMWEYVGAVSEQRQATGELVKLCTEQQQEAVRVAQRLHRNVGHPDPHALVDLLTARNARFLKLSGPTSAWHATSTTSRIKWLLLRSQCPVSSMIRFMLMSSM